MSIARPLQAREEAELGELTVSPADDALVFGEGLDERWERAIGKLGISAAMLSGDAGHA